MKKLRLLLALIAASIGSLHSVWAANRPAPQRPDGVTTIESGQTYYLYNVMEDKFLGRSSTSYSYAALTTYGDKVKVTKADNGTYTIQWASNNYYFWSYDSYISGSYNYAASNYSYFTFSEASYGYTIQRAPGNQYYDATEFVGFDGTNGDRLSPALGEGSIYWQLLPETEADYYIAKLKLYHNLEVADQYNFYVTQYDVVYNNPEATTDELDFAQATLANALEMSANYVSPSWTEYPIIFQNNTDNKWQLSSDKSYLYWQTEYNHPEPLTSTLTATVNVDNSATLSYVFSGASYSTMRVYLDGELVQTINSTEGQCQRRFFVEMAPGHHDIAWTCVFNYTGNGYYSNSLKEIGIQNTPTLRPQAVLNEGGLGTEVLALGGITGMKDVRKIVVTGKIGTDDWNTLGLMTNAYSIDLSQAEVVDGNLPASLFKGDSRMFLHEVKLPEGVTSIGESAFNNSNIEDITLPSTLKTIGQYAFQGSKVATAIIPDGVTEVGRDAFADCYFLKTASFPASATVIPYSCFRSCYQLRPFTIPEGITEVGNQAFYSASNFSSSLPSTLQVIDYGAFEYSGMVEAVLPDGITEVGNYAFGHCSNLIRAELPTTFYSITGSKGYYMFSNCPNLTDVYLKSPTVVTGGGGNDFFNNNAYSNITLHVPDFLLASYKLDSYWYNYNPVAFSSADMSDWVINNPLTLNNGVRIGGTPNLKINGYGQLITYGDDAMTMGSLSTFANPSGVNSYYYTSSSDICFSEVLVNGENITVGGDFTHRLRVYEKTWYFVSLPFDAKVSDIVADQGASFVVRYYDGASRATGASGNWKNYEADDVIAAGTGFIVQASKTCNVIFKAQDNASKQYALSNKLFAKALTQYAADATANMGWNLVGNPWLTYYNIHKLNFTAPITVWKVDGYGNGKYEAYSIIDDDYALKPGEAFFVQCPDDVNKIEFPIDGRQLTSEITDQNGVRPMFGAPKSRLLVDLELSDGEQSDKTRLVINEQAQQAYELQRDASKFPAMSADVPQLYTLDEQNTQYAINERPTGEAVVSLGFYAPQSGTYTIEATRNNLKAITLVDTETGQTTDLATGSYTFQAEAGTSNTRFYIDLSNQGVATAVEAVDAAGQRQGDEVYNLQGQRVKAGKKGLYIVDGKKVMK